MKLESDSPNLYPNFQLEACAHPFFDDLRDPNVSLPNGRALPPLFNFTAQGRTDLTLSFFSLISTPLPLLMANTFAELSGASTELRCRLIPEHARN